MALPAQMQAQTLVLDTLPAVEVLAELDRPSQVFAEQSWALDSLPNADMNELLGQHSALFLKDYGPGGISTLTYRGAVAQQHQVLWNGMPINAPSLGLVDLNTLPTALLDEVTLHPGASALMLGSGALGSALNLESSVDPDGPAWRYGLETAPYLGRLVQHLSYSGHIGRFHHRIRIMHSEAENAFDYTDDSGPESMVRQREQAEEEMFGLATDMAYSWKDGALTRLSVQHVDFNREIPAPVGLVTTDQTQEDVNTRFMIRHGLERDSWALEAAIGGTQEDFLYQDPDKDIFSELGSESYFARLTGRLELNDYTTIRTRMEHLDTNVDTENYLEDSRQSRQGVFVELERQQGRFQAQAGVRMEWVDGQEQPLTGVVGLRYRLDDQWSVFSQAGKSYRLPSFNDMYWVQGGNPDLEREEGRSLDFGFQREQRNFNLRINLYTNVMDELILWLPTSEGFWSPFNQFRVRSRGVELFMDYRHESGWYAQGDVGYNETYEWMDSPIIDPVEDVQLPYTPVWTARFSSGYRDKTNHFFLRGRFNGETFTDRSNDETISHSFPIELGGEKTFQIEDLTYRLGLRVHNILDEEYELVLDRPLPGRYLSIHINFDLK
jgi:iron complex outermembrane receptor protein